MRAVLVALGVSAAFAVFFAVFLVVPVLLIAVGYVWMTADHNRRSRRARAARDADDDPQDETLLLPAGPGTGAVGPPATLAKPPLIGGPA